MPRRVFMPIVYARSPTTRPLTQLPASMPRVDRPAPGGTMVRNALHLGLGQVATTVLTVALSAAIARTLGAADFGLLYVLTSIATFAYVFVDWGHGPYVTRETARHPNRSGELMGS